MKRHTKVFTFLLTLTIMGCNSDTKTNSIEVNGQDKLFSEIILDVEQTIKSDSIFNSNIKLKFKKIQGMMKEITRLNEQNRYYNTKLNETTTLAFSYAKGGYIKRGKEDARGESEVEYLWNTYVLNSIKDIEPVKVNIEENINLLNSKINQLQLEMSALNLSIETGIIYDSSEVEGPF